MWLHGYVATQLHGYSSKWLHGCGVTWIFDCAAEGICGYGATRFYVELRVSWILHELILHEIAVFFSATLFGQTEN